MNPLPPAGSPPAVAPPAVSAEHPGRTRFESELQVRPDDLDMNAHVHASRYLDYVLAARYDQMTRCYGMGMEAFLARGLNWFTRTSHVEYKRPLKLGERFVVRTWIETFFRDGVRVEFQILKRDTGKLAADGWAHFTLVNVRTGRAEPLPTDILALYTV